MAGLLHLHSFWTRPQFDSDAAWRSGDMVIWDFEMVTWLASVLQARRHGRIRLVTDSRGMEFIRRVGMDGLYDAGVSTELDDIPAVLDSRLFWAAAKLYGLRRVEEPVLSLDTDALFWEPFVPSAPVMALHPEDGAWAWYAGNAARYAGMGFAGRGWDWSLAPFTTGMLYVASPSIAREYAETAIGFMERCSRLARRRSTWLGDFGDAMLFAEQRLLPMVVARRGLGVQAIAERHPTECLLQKNPRCLHLWGTKAAYRLCPEARCAYRDHLAAFVAREHPEAGKILRRWRLGEGGGTNAAGGDARGETPPQTAFHLIRSVRGVVSIIDSNVDARRRAYAGCWVLPGETVEAGSDGAFEIDVQGAGRLSICNPCEV